MVGAMVLELTGAPGQRATLGPAEWYRLVGAQLHAGATHQLLAEYHNGFWKTDIAQFTSIRCEEPCTCHFEHGTGRADDVEGPYGTINLIGAVLWADDYALARLDPVSKLWKLLRTGNDYASICWRPAQTGPHPRVQVERRTRH